MLPSFLQPGDRIHIVSPSGSIDSAFIDGAKKVLASKGFYVTEGKFARGEYGRFAGTVDERIADMQEAIDSSEVKAILCSRGGYGVSQIIDKIDFSLFRQRPKWLIGFSDITILHAAINRAEIASIHGIMAKHITELPENCEQLNKMLEILMGKFPVYTVKGETINKPGKASGVLVGGNLSVLMGLRGTPFEPDYEGKILFIEDIAEKPYHIDRMMQNLRLSGIMDKISGLVVGQFSDCEEDPLMHQTINGIILSAVGNNNYPVCFNFPAGHVDDNLPLVLGASVSLEVNVTNAILSF